MRASLLACVAALLLLALAAGAKPASAQSTGIGGPVTSQQLNAAYNVIQNATANVDTTFRFGSSASGLPRVLVESDLSSAILLRPVSGAELADLRLPAGVVPLEFDGGSAAGTIVALQLTIYEDSRSSFLNAVLQVDATAALRRVRAMGYFRLSVFYRDTLDSVWRQEQYGDVVGGIGVGYHAGIYVLASPNFQAYQPVSASAPASFVRAYSLRQSILLQRVGQVAPAYDVALDIPEYGLDSSTFAVSTPSDTFPPTQAARQLGAQLLSQLYVFDMTDSFSSGTLRFDASSRSPSERSRIRWGRFDAAAGVWAVYYADMELSTSVAFLRVDSFYVPLLGATWGVLLFDVTATPPPPPSTTPTWNYGWGSSSTGVWSPPADGSGNGPSNPPSTSPGTEYRVVRVGASAVFMRQVGVEQSFMVQRVGQVAPAYDMALDIPSYGLAYTAVIISAPEGTAALVSAAAQLGAQILSQLYVFEMTYSVTSGTLRFDASSLTQAQQSRLRWGRFEATSNAWLVYGADVEPSTGVASLRVDASVFLLWATWGVLLFDAAVTPPPPPPTPTYGWGSSTGVWSPPAGGNGNGPSDLPPPPPASSFPPGVVPQSAVPGLLWAIPPAGAAYSFGSNSGPPYIGAAGAGRLNVSVANSEDAKKVESFGIKGFPAGFAAPATTFSVGGQAASGLTIGSTDSGTRVNVSFPLSSEQQAQFSAGTLGVLHFDASAAAYARVPRSFLSLDAAASVLVVTLGKTGTYYIVQVDTQPTMQEVKAGGPPTRFLLAANSDKDGASPSIAINSTRGVAVRLGGIVAAAGSFSASISTSAPKQEAQIASAGKALLSEIYTYEYASASGAKSDFTSAQLSFELSAAFSKAAAAGMESVSEWPTGSVGAAVAQAANAKLSWYRQQHGSDVWEEVPSVLVDGKLVATVSGFSDWSVQAATVLQEVDDDDSAAVAASGQLSLASLVAALFAAVAAAMLA